MAGSKIRAMQTEGVDRGKLQVNVTGSRRHRPIPNARIQLSYTADPETELELSLIHISEPTRRS